MLSPKTKWRTIKMRIVKREGEWRLEKIEDGRYVITKRKKVEIITPDYVPSVNTFDGD